MFNQTIINIATEIKAAGGTLFAVGGFVRDTLLGRHPKDIDFVHIGVDIDFFVNVLRQHGTVDTNTAPHQIGAFVCVLTTPDGQSFEFAMARSEASTGQGKAEVIVSQAASVEEDARRRDVTINAIFQNVLSGELVDPLGGVSDIKARILRPTPQFNESAERVLRVAGLVGMLGFDVDPLIVKLAHSMDKSAVRGDQNWKQGWSRIGRCQFPERFVAFLSTAGWLPQTLTSMDPMALAGASSQAEMFSRIAQAVGADRFAQFMSEIFAPKQVSADALAFGKPNRRQFRVIANRMIMRHQSGRKPGPWVSELADKLFAMACQMGEMDEEAMTEMVKRALG